MPKRTPDASGSQEPPPESDVTVEKSDAPLLGGGQASTLKYAQPHKVGIDQNRSKMSRASVQKHFLGHSTFHHRFTHSMSGGSHGLKFTDRLDSLRSGHCLMRASMTVQRHHLLPSQPQVDSAKQNLAAPVESQMPQPARRGTKGQVVEATVVDLQNEFLEDGADFESEQLYCLRNFHETVEAETQAAIIPAGVDIPWCQCDLQCALRKVNDEVVDPEG